MRNSTPRRIPPLPTLRRFSVMILSTIEGVGFRLQRFYLRELGPICNSGAPFEFFVSTGPGYGSLRLDWRNPTMDPWPPKLSRGPLRFYVGPNFWWLQPHSTGHLSFLFPLFGRNLLHIIYIFLFCFYLVVGPHGSCSLWLQWYNLRHFD